MFRLNLAVAAAALTASSAMAQLATPGGVVLHDGGLADLLNVTQFTSQQLELPGQPGEGFAVWVNIAGVDRVLLLHPHSVRADNYQTYVDTGAGLQLAADSMPTTYRGHVVGVPDSGVAASLYNGQLDALVEMGRGDRWFVQPITDVLPSANPADHAVYSVDDCVSEPDWLCGAENLDNVHLQDFFGGDTGPRSPGNDLAEIAFDADYEFYVKNGSSVPATEADIETVLNNVDFIYDRDCQINYVITTIIVRSSSNDPYTSTDAGTRLSQFRSYWLANHGSVQRDVAHLMTGASLDGSVIGVAWLSGICNSYGFGLSESRFSGNANYRMSLTAHELGHNWSSDHCDGDNDCHIMCSGINGCMGLGQPNFGSRAINSITNFANGLNCLDIVDDPNSGLVHQYVEVPITGQAQADDATLVQAKTFDLQVVITNADDWTSSDTTATIDGLFYQHPTLDGDVPQSVLWGTFPSLEFDSFFSAPNMAAPGFADGPVVAPGSMYGLYFDTANTGEGTFTIGRFTVTSGTNLSIDGASTAANTQGQLLYFGFDIPVNFPSLLHQVTEVAISQDAISDDPTLAGAKTFDLQAETLNGDDWTSTDAVASIDGTIYQHPNFDGNTPQGALWGTFPSLEFDSFFAAPGFTTPGFADGPNITNNSMSAIWFDVPNTGEGVFTIARYTVTAGTTLSITGTSTAANTGGDLVPFDFSVDVDLSPPCPGDLNGDGQRDQSDLGVLLASYQIDAGGDIDGDGDTDQADLGALLAVYNVPCP